MLTSYKAEPGSTLRIYAPLPTMSSHHTLTGRCHSVSIEVRSSDPKNEEGYRERRA